MLKKYLALKIFGKLNFQFFSKKHLLQLLLPTTLIGLTGCGAERLESLKKAMVNTQLITPEVTALSANINTLDPKVFQTQLKFIYVVDRSGSNGNTDPTGRRYTALIDFVTQQQTASDEKNIFNSFIPFSGSSAIVEIPFTKDKQSFITAMSSAKNAPNGGETPYKAALSSVRALIESDARNTVTQNQDIRINYAVFFMSDGFPSDFTNGSEDAQMTSAVNSIMDLTQGSYKTAIKSIMINTGYYYVGTPDASAQGLLAKMAQIGGGSALVVDSTQPIDFNKFSLPTETQLQIRLVDVFVANMNTVWEDGKLKLDRDGDGLSDELEMRLGSNSYLSDSDGNGVSDGVEYRLSGRACQDPKCAITARASFPECDNLPKTQQDKIIFFLDSDHDGLNDCEERLLMSNSSQFDSNKDWIPDGLAFKRGIAFLSGNRDDDKDPDQDGVSNYMEVKYNMPIVLANKSLIDFKPFDYVLTPVSSTATSKSYQISVQNIPIIGASNRIRIYLLENSTTTKDIRFMRVAETMIHSGETIQLENIDFGTPSHFECEIGKADCP